MTSAAIRASTSQGLWKSFKVSKSEVIDNTVPRERERSVAYSCVKVMLEDMLTVLVASMFVVACDFRWCRKREDCRRSANVSVGFIQKEGKLSKLFGDSEGSRPSIQGLLAPASESGSWEEGER